MIISPKAVIDLTLAQALTSACENARAGPPKGEPDRVRSLCRNRTYGLRTQIADGRAAAAFSRLLIHCSLVKELPTHFAVAGPGIITVLAIFASRNLRNLQFSALGRVSHPATAHEKHGLTPPAVDLALSTREYADLVGLTERIDTTNAAGRIDSRMPAVPAEFDWARLDSNQRRRCQRVYSPSPLATWVHALGVSTRIVAAIPSAADVDPTGDDNVILAAARVKTAGRPSPLPQLACASI